MPSPLVNYLTAARAAHEMGDPDGRDNLLGLFATAELREVRALDAVNALVNHPDATVRQAAERTLQILAESFSAAGVPGRVEYLKE